MTPEQEIVYDLIDTVPVAVYEWERWLSELYDSFNAKWFHNSLPPVSDTFVCEFCDLPQEAAGIYVDPARAAELSTDRVTVRTGIRINSKLQCHSDVVRIALLHEMVHASGIEKHAGDFKAAIARLLSAGAYNDLL